MRKNVEKTEQKFKTAELIDEVEIQKIKNIESEITQEYKHGWVTDIEEERIPIGLSEEVVRMISNKKDEPEWLLEWRLKAYRHWLTMKEPTWAAVDYKPIDYKPI